MASMRVSSPSLRLAVPILAVACGCGARATEAYVAPSPEPTPEETQILEYINRFRADPKAEAERIAPPGKAVDGIAGAVDLEMFRKEMAALPPAMPLVFNLQLLEAARQHSQYMILNELGHVEDPAKPGFYAASFGDRCAKAGYPMAMAENCYRDARNPWQSQIGFLVDFGPGGPGGMQEGRGHRRNLALPQAREIGPAAVAHDGRLSVTHDLGVRGVPRFVGGVVFVDLDQDGFYGLGEGRGGVAITASDGSHATTWASGAYVIELKGTGAVRLKAEFAGAQIARDFPASSDTIAFTWPMPRKIDFDFADKLIAEVDKQLDKPDSPAAFKALIALHLGTRGLALDPPRQARIDELAKHAGEELSACQQAVRNALAGDGVTFKQVVAEQGKAYRGTAAAAWFTGAASLFQARQAASGYEKQAKQVTPTKQRELIQQLESLRDAMPDAELRGLMAPVIARVRSGGA